MGTDFKKGQAEQWKRHRDATFEAIRTQGTLNGVARPAASTTVQVRLLDKGLKPGQRLIVHIAGGAVELHHGRSVVARAVGSQASALGIDGEHGKPPVVVQVCQVSPALGTAEVMPISPGATVGIAAGTGEPAFIGSAKDQ